MPRVQALEMPSILRNCRHDVYNSMITSKRPMPRDKSERLRASRTLNPHPEAVSDPLFGRVGGWRAYP